mgnify:CR=1 FL=1
MSIKKGIANYHPACINISMQAKAGPLKKHENFQYDEVPTGKESYGIDSLLYCTAVYIPADQKLSLPVSCMPSKNAPGFPNATCGGKSHLCFLFQYMQYLYYACGKVQKAVG